jgi:CspA family cold shock protein
MAKGKVKWFNLKKGYGFIQPDEGDKDIFVHISALQNSGIRNLFEDQEVSYDVAEEKGKISAVNIKLSE